MRLPLGGVAVVGGGEVMRVMVVAFCLCRAVPLSPRTLSHLWLVGGGLTGHKWDELRHNGDGLGVCGGKGGAAEREARREGPRAASSHMWLVEGGSGGHKWDEVRDKWDEVLARGGGVAGGQWNWAVSVEPARARVALSGLSAVETTSK